MLLSVQLEKQKKRDKNLIKKLRLMRFFLIEKRIGKPFI